MASAVTRQGFPYRKRRILLVDLDRERGEYLPLDAEDGRRFFGGGLLGMRLWDRYADYGKQRQTLYDEGNPVVFSLGALGDLDLPGIGGFTVTTKSPVTGRVATASGDGGFGAGIRALGVSAIVITGRLSRTGALVLDGSQSTFLVDEQLHDLTTDAVRKRYEGWHVATIGPAAEHGVRFSSVVCDGENLGRGGIGLVLATKNLKAIAIRGSWRERISYDPVGASKLMERYEDAKCRHPADLIAAARRGGWAALLGFSEYTDGRLWALEGYGPRWLEALAVGPDVGVFSPGRISRLLSVCDAMGIDAVGAGMFLSCIREETDDAVPWEEALASTGARLSRYSRFLERMEDERYQGGGLPLLPIDLRASRPMALLEATGDDTLPFEDLLGPSCSAEDAPGQALRARVVRAAMELLGLPASFHAAVCLDPSFRPFAVMAALATAGEGYLIDEGMMEEAAWRSLRLKKELDVRAGAPEPGPLPDRFRIEPMRGDPLERTLLIAGPLDIYRRLCASNGI